MSFGNGSSVGGDSLGSSSIGNAIADYMNGNDSNYGTVGNFVNNYLNSGIDGIDTDGSAVGNSIIDYISKGNSIGDVLGSSGSNNGVINGSWFNTLGRLGTGLLGALGDYDASANQQTYIPYTQWLGNGLAGFSMINNTMNKQQQKNNAYGNTLMLSSLFGPGKSLLSKFGGQIGRNYNDDIYNNNLGGYSLYTNIKPRYTNNGIEWLDEKDVTI